jgi:D-inositol-3-phosphate glycosyltransferase
MTKKLLFFATYPTVPVGYGKIGNILTNFLAEIEENGKPKYDIYYIGISNFSGRSIQRFVDPRIKIIDALEESSKINSSELYGVDIINKYVSEIKPDILFIYNDLIVVNRLLTELKSQHKTYKTYIYIDLVYDYEKISLVKNIDILSDKIFVFSEHWKQNLIAMDVNPEKIKILYHGFSKNQFHKVSKKEARARLGLSDEDFIILNTNRNTYRKALDISIESFLQFIKTKEDKNIKMFMNCEIETPSGYNILNLIETSCKKLNLNYDDITQNRILRFPNSGNVSDSMINDLYNACDIGINTCLGEGFGLCNMEHAGLEIPQVVTETGGLIDIFKPFCEGFPYLVKPITSIYISNLQDFHGGYIDIPKSEDFVKSLDYWYENKDKISTEGEKIGKYIKQKYNWDTILEKFAIDLEM